MKKGKMPPVDAGGETNSIATDDSAAIVYKLSDEFLDFDEMVPDEHVVFRKGYEEILDVVLEDAPGDDEMVNQIKRARAAFLAGRGR